MGPRLTFYIWLLKLALCSARAIRQVKVIFDNCKDKTTFFSLQTRRLFIFETKSFVLLEIDKIVKEIRGVLKKQRGLKE